MSSSASFEITQLNRADYDEWAVLFRAYIDFYKSSIEDGQYHKTFERILDPNSTLGALVVRKVEGDESKIIGLAHFFPEQTSWNEKEIMLLNGESLPSM